MAPYRYNTKQVYPVDLDHRCPRETDNVRFVRGLATLH